jgi:16S rRNA (cytidine1402-2'-O)-methyltransferase
VGTFYVVGATAGNPSDLTRRAQRILNEVALVVSADRGQARRLLAHYELATPLADAVEEAVLEGLEAGDVALLEAGWSAGSSGPGYQLVSSAVERGFPVVPVPGPTLPITSLVISGLPADGFIYLGWLPRQLSARRVLLESVVSERRTLVVVESPDRLPVAWADLHAALGERALAVATESESGTEVIWRGMLGEGLEELAGLSVGDPSVLLIGGAPEHKARWCRDRLSLEVQTLLARGLNAKEIGRRLALESGWPRREIYRLAVEASRHEEERVSDPDAEPERI